MNDPAVEDILINGHKQVFVSRGGIMQPQVLHFADDAHLLRMIQRVIAPLGRRLDESTPMVDARLPGGGRLNAVIAPLALDGPLVSIRKFRKDPYGMEDLQRLGALVTTWRSCWSRPYVTAATSSSVAEPARAKRPCSMHWPVISPHRSGLSPLKIRLSLA